MVVLDCESWVHMLKPFKAAAVHSGTAEHTADHVLLLWLFSSLLFPFLAPLQFFSILPSLLPPRQLSLLLSSFPLNQSLGPTYFCNSWDGNGREDWVMPTKRWCTLGLRRSSPSMDPLDFKAANPWAKKYGYYWTPYVAADTAATASADGVADVVNVVFLFFE